LALPKVLNEVGAAATACAAIQKGATVSSTGLASIISKMPPKLIASAMATNKLSEAEMKEALRTSTLTLEKKQEVWQHYNVITAKKAEAVATNELTASTVTFKGVMQGLNATLFASPWFWVAAAVAAVAGVFALAKAEAEKYTKQLSKLREEYSELDGQLSELEGTLQSNRERLKELEDIEAPTLADESEIQKLRTANAELETQIALLKEAKQEKQKDIDNTFNDYVQQQQARTFTYSAPTTVENMIDATSTGGLRTSTGATSTRNFEEEIQHQIEVATNAQKQIEANVQAMEHTTDAAEKKRLEESNKTLRKTRDEARNTLKEFEADWSAAAEGVEYNENTAPGLDMLHDLQIAITMLSDDTAVAKAGLNQLFNDPRYAGEDGAIESLRNAIDEYGDTAEDLKTKIQGLYATNPQVKELIDTLIRLGYFSWDNLDGLVNQLSDVADAADDVTEAVSGWSDLSDATDKLVSATETLRSAQKELQSGYLSAGTLKSMQEQYDTMTDIIVQYKLGMVTAQQVYAEYKRLYEQDKASFKQQNSLKLALTEEFFNKSIKGNADYIKILGSYYTSDLKNFKELASEKLKIDTRLMQRLGENWSKVYSSYAQAVNASYGDVMSKEVFEKRNPGDDYNAYLQSRNRGKLFKMTDDEKAQYSEYMRLARLFDDLAKKAGEDLNISIPDFTKTSSSTSNASNASKTKKSMDEVYADLKALMDETERQNDRLSNMTQDTTAEQIALWYKVRNAAIKRMGEITDHTSEAYRYLEDMVKKANSNISSLYDNQLSAIDKIIDLTKDMLKKEADDQVDALQDQADKYREIVALKKKLLEQSSDEEDYEKQVAKIVKEIADLQEAISQLDLEIKSNPDDSRKAQAEQQKLLQDLQSKQDELAALQKNHWKDALTDRLDDEADAFDKSKQEEIDKIKETVEDDKKLHQKAIDYIDKHWSDLYSKLSKYAKSQGRDVEKELTKAWDVAKDAVDAYGGSILDAMDNIEKMQSMIQSTNKEGNYNQVGELAGNPQLMAIVKAMKKNSTDYLATSDPTTKKNIKQSQAALVKQFEAISGHQLAQGSDGTWYLDKVGGETVYSHFGVGDVVNPNRPSGSTSGGTKNPYSKPSNKQVLKSGSSGSNVAWVQTQLNKAASKDGNSAFKVSVDSKYGAKTEAAVRAFQRAKGLSADGQVGPKTLALLEKYHKGGIVGGNATLKDNEMLAVLEKKETVLTNSMWKNLSEKLLAVQDFIKSSLPVIDRFPAGSVPAYSGAGGMTVSPVVNVRFEHHGDFDEKAARKFANQISDLTIKQIEKNAQTHKFRK
jgi:putative peptidoglycan binding domain